MESSVSSVVIGTSGLTIAAFVALMLALARAGVAPDQVRRLQLVGSLLVLLQVTHFAEEYLFHFYVRFPELLGLAPWPEEFFVAFNLFWLVMWVAAIANIDRIPRIALFLLWFLAIASAVNGIAHPLLSLTAGGYFPGLWTSPFVGILGVILLYSLTSATTTTVRDNVHGDT